MPKEVGTRPTPKPSEAPAPQDPYAASRPVLNARRLAFLEHGLRTVHGVAQIRDDGDDFRRTWARATEQLVSTRWRTSPTAVVHARPAITAATRETTSASRSPSRQRQLPRRLRSAPDHGHQRPGRAVENVKLTVEASNPRLRIDSQPPVLRIGPKSRATVDVSVTALGGRPGAAPHHPDHPGRHRHRRRAPTSRSGHPHRQLGLLGARRCRGHHPRARYRAHRPAPAAPRATPPTPIPPSRLSDTSPDERLPRRLAERSLARSSAVMAAGHDRPRGCSGSSGPRCSPRWSASAWPPTPSTWPTRCPTSSTCCSPAACSTPCSSRRSPRPPRHDDGGDEFVNRLLTLSLRHHRGRHRGRHRRSRRCSCGCSPHGWNRRRPRAGHRVRRSSACPQVFFYGLYTLLGQVLNARGQFAAYMWAPALANLVAIAGPGRRSASPTPQQIPVAEWTAADGLAARRHRHPRRRRPGGGAASSRCAAAGSATARSGASAASACGSRLPGGAVDLRRPRR